MHLYIYIYMYTNTLILFYVFTSMVLKLVYVCRKCTSKMPYIYMTFITVANDALRVAVGVVSHSHHHQPSLS